MSFTRKSFELLQDLESNNNKEWYDKHRDEIKEYLREPFADVLETASGKTKRLKYAMRGGKQTMFRQHRDIRFSKDKRPYSTHVSGLMTETGDKSENGGLTYVHLDKEGGFIATGFHRLPTNELNLIRDHMIEQPKRFKRIAKKIEASDYNFMQDDKLKSMPRGYNEHADGPLADYLKLKSLIVRKSQPKTVWLDGSIVDEIVNLVKSSTDLIAFGTEALETR